MILDGFHLRKIILLPRGYERGYMRIRLDVPLSVKSTKVRKKDLLRINSAEKIIYIHLNFRFQESPELLVSED